ncbi:hypothetical protein [Algoriphagus aquimarinus]|uniref:Uncharacterized protein n=1 Tax=Algoriphagus aquimarinus TaxID=237018 RepID=A0A5C7B1X2_9BACT|nr:hypothetical protein [Algoriphagus aquimarinus]TXE14464.1 hypothetical protein ESV85_02540 [Algoriphagus aquimarinus]
MKYYEVHIPYFIAKRDPGFEIKDGETAMESQIKIVKDLFSSLIPTQIFKANKRLADFLSPSADLSSRIILSTRAKALIERYRKGNIRYYPCPIMRGKEMVSDYWITDKVTFDDEWVDFPKSEFFFRKRKLISNESEIRLKYEVTEQIIQFKDLDDFNKFRNEKMWHMDERFPFKIFIKKGCPHHILSIHTTGPRYLIVSEELKNEMQIQKMNKGIEFKPLEIPDEEWFGPNGLRKQFYS